MERSDFSALSQESPIQDEEVALPAVAVAGRSFIRPVVAGAGAVLVGVALIFGAVFVGGSTTVVDTQKVSLLFNSEPSEWTKVSDGSICAEHGRIAVDCGQCGPNWNDLNACKRLCEGEPTCSYISYFHDRGCRLYSSCASPVPYTAVGTEIHRRVVPANTPDITWARADAHNGRVACDETNRLAAPCDGCGPHWGDLDRCKTLCNLQPGCNSIAYYDDRGCRLFSSCAGTALGHALVTVYHKTVHATTTSTPTTTTTTTTTTEAPATYTNLQPVFGNGQCRDKQYRSFPRWEATRMSIYSGDSSKVTRDRCRDECSKLGRACIGFAIKMSYICTVYFGDGGTYGTCQTASRPSYFQQLCHNHGDVAIEQVYRPTSLSHAAMLDNLLYTCYKKDPVFTNIGEGQCVDSRGRTFPSWSLNDWNAQWGIVSADMCRETCAKAAGCIGFNVRSHMDDSSKKIACNVYFSKHDMNTYTKRSNVEKALPHHGWKTSYSADGTGGVDHAKPDVWKKLSCYRRT